MEFSILGPLRVGPADRPLDLGGRLQRGLLAELLASPNVPVSDDRLIDELWGDEAPRSARHLLQVYASRLRKVLRHARRRSAHRRQGTWLRPATRGRRASTRDSFWTGSPPVATYAIASPGPPSISSPRRWACGTRTIRGCHRCAAGDPGASCVPRAPVSRGAQTRVELRLGSVTTAAHPELVSLVEAYPYDDPGWSPDGDVRSGRQAEALEAGRAVRAPARRPPDRSSPTSRRLYQQILVQDPGLGFGATEPPSNLRAR
jgi:hypothetical protein